MFEYLTTATAFDLIKLSTSKTVRYAKLTRIYKTIVTGIPIRIDRGKFLSGF